MTKTEITEVSIQFRKYWNAKDLNGLATLYASNIELHTPEIDFGFFVLPSKKNQGLQQVLKFQGSVLDRFHMYVSEVQFIEFGSTNKAVVFYPDNGFKCSADISFNSKGKIEFMKFHTLVYLDSEKKVSPYRILFQHVSYKVKKVLALNN